MIINIYLSIYQNVLFPRTKTLQDMLSLACLVQQTLATVEKGAPNEETAFASKDMRVTLQDM